MPVIRPEIISESTFQGDERDYPSPHVHSGFPWTLPTVTSSMAKTSSTDDVGMAYTCSLHLTRRARMMARVRGSLRVTTVPSPSFGSGTSIWAVHLLEVCPDDIHPNPAAGYLRRHISSRESRHEDELQRLLLGQLLGDFL